MSVLGSIQKETAHNSSTTLMLPDSLLTIADQAFVQNGAESVIIPNGATNIGSTAFAFSDTLKRVDIPASVTGIAADAFRNCPNLTLFVPMGSYAEQYCLNNGLRVVRQWLP